MKCAHCGFDDSCAPRLYKNVIESGKPTCVGCRMTNELAAREQSRRDNPGRGEQR